MPEPTPSPVDVPDELLRLALTEYFNDGRERLEDFGYGGDGDTVTAMADALAAVLTAAEQRYKGIAEGLQAELRAAIKAQGEAEAAGGRARDETARQRQRAEALEVDLRQERAVHEQTVERAEQAEARLAELENALTWQTSCTSCSRLLDSGYAETMRAEQAEAAVQRSREALAAFDGRGVSTPVGSDWNIPTAGEVLDAWRASLAALDRPADPPAKETR